MKNALKLLAAGAWKIAIFEPGKGVFFMGQYDNIEILPDDLTTYENRIFQAVEDFCLSQNIESLKQEPQNVFMACLMYVNRQVFKRDKPGKNNQKSVLNLEDVELLSGIADIYIYLATVNNKSCSVQDFCRLIGLDYQTVYNWKSDSSDNILSQKRFEIFKRITGAREETLSNMLQTAKSPVGILGILNRQFSWNLPGVSREESKPRLSRSDMLQGLDALPEKVEAAAGESSQIPREDATTLGIGQTAQSDGADFVQNER